jgi:prepilin-type processing-associated H-X9-DG protein
LFSSWVYAWAAARTADGAVDSVTSVPAASNTTAGDCDDSIWKMHLMNCAFFDGSVRHTW